MDEAYLNKHTVYKVTHGSRAYGTNLPDSDVDERGFAVLTDKRYYFGFKKFEQKDSGWSDGVDRCIFDIRKFVKLAINCNPNVIEIFYVDPSDVIYQSPCVKELLEHKDVFLSRRAAKSFGGYAYGQLKLCENRLRAGKELKHKHVSHLVRLLRMALEIVRDGRVVVRRPDAAELLSIRQGNYDYDEIVAWSREMLDKVDVAVAKSPLPPYPDVDFIEKLLIDVHYKTLFEQ